MIWAGLEKIRRFVVEHYYRGLARDYCKAPKSLSVLGPIRFMNKSVVFGENVKLYPGVTFFGEGKITIGNNVKIGQNVIIFAGSGSEVEIGDNSIIAANVYIIDSNHRFHKEKIIQEQGLSSEMLHIGKDSWIAANSVISKGTNLGDGVIIGALTHISGQVEEGRVVSSSQNLLEKVRR